MIPENPRQLRDGGFRLAPHSGFWFNRDMANQWIIKFTLRNGEKFSEIVEGNVEAVTKQMADALDAGNQTDSYRDGDTLHLTYDGATATVTKNKNTLTTRQRTGGQGY